MFMSIHPLYFWSMLHGRQAMAELAEAAVRQARDRPAAPPAPADPAAGAARPTPAKGKAARDGGKPRHDAPHAARLKARQVEARQAVKTRPKAGAPRGR